MYLIQTLDVKDIYIYVVILLKKLIKRKQNVFNLVAYIFKYNIRINILTKKNNK